MTRLCLECNTPLLGDAHHLQKYCDKSCRYRNRYARRRDRYVCKGPFTLTCAECDTVFVHEHRNTKTCGTVCFETRTKRQWVEQAKRHRERQEEDASEELLSTLLDMGFSDETMAEFGFERVV